jgi:hypothetical protein
MYRIVLHRNVAHRIGSLVIDREWRVALHEAGHCVVARLLQLPHCGAASIRPRGSSLGHAHFPVDRGPASICALMAGAAVEVTAFGDYDRIGNTADAKLIERFDGDIDALWDCALNLAQQYRSLIVRTAIKLRRARTLDGASIDRIVLRG